MSSTFTTPRKTLTAPCRRDLGRKLPNTAPIHLLLPPRRSIKQGGVCYTKGNVTILEGYYAGNLAEADGEAKGGVIFGAEGGNVSIAGGVFERNAAKDGGMAFVFSGGALAVAGGQFTGNVAGNSGGVISVVEDGTVEVSRRSSRRRYGLRELSGTPASRNRSNAYNAR